MSRYCIGCGTRYGTAHKPDCVRFVPEFTQLEQQLINDFIRLKNLTKLYIDGQLSDDRYVELVHSMATKNAKGSIVE
jgi:hypothetical protein